MATTYTFAIPEGRTADELLERARTEGRSRGIAFSGDATAGQFRGTAEGTYRVEGGRISVVVEKKPAFVPWGVVENALKRLFTS